MTAIPASIAVEAAMTRQAVALEVVKQNAQADRQIANILTQAIESVPKGGHGSVVNIQA